MAYVLLPDTGQSLGQTRTQIRTNFDTLQTTINANHVSLTASNGKHKFCQFPVGGLPAGLGAGDNTVYSKTAGAESQLFTTPDASGNEYQLTRCITGSFTLFGTNTAYAANHLGGWTFLPGGMLLQYGLRSSPGSSGQITFPRAFTNVPYSINVVNYRDSARSASVSSSTVPTTTTFNYFLETSGSSGLYWWAIGV